MPETIVQQEEERGKAQADHEAKLPGISVVIPTLNAARVLRECLESIYQQDYPKGLVEILIVDGGSCDETLSIVHEFMNDDRFKLEVLANPLRTGEAGKAIGAKRAGYEIIAFIDSDNILPDRDWLKRMAQAFGDERILAAEPLRFAYRKEDSSINRYCALIGMNDPLCLFMGNYDRYSAVTGTWTEMPVTVENRGTYLYVTGTVGTLPTFGANGFLVRRSKLMDAGVGDYLFDVDMVDELLMQNETMAIAKTDNSIGHLYCRDVRTFLRKQRRRVIDYLKYSGNERKQYPWGRRKKIGLGVFVLSCLLVFPLVWQAMIGMLRKPDSCWLFHPLACWVTCWIYGCAWMRQKVGSQVNQSRSAWSQ